MKNSGKQWATVRQSIQILPVQARRRLILASIVQVSLNFLDLAGLALIAGIGSLSLHAMKGTSSGPTVEFILRAVKIDNLDVIQQVSVLASLSIILFATKTVVSILLMKKIFLFLNRIGANLAVDITSRIIRKDLTQVQEKSSQELLFNTTNGVIVITNTILASVIAIVADLSLAVIIFSGIVIVDPKIGLFSLLIFAPLFGVLYLALRKVSVRTGEAITDITLQSNLKILEVIGASREIAVNNRRGFYLEAIRAKRESLANHLAIQALLPNSLKYIVDLSLVTGIFLLALIQFNFENPTRAAATLVLFTAAGTRFAPALLRVQQSFLMIANGSGLASRTLRFELETREWPKVSLEAKSFSRTHSDFVGEICIKNVSFGFPGVDKELFTKLNLSVHYGEFLAIVGKSGSGKSTLVDLILGLHKPLTGVVEISGKAPEIAFSTWPGAIGYVPQQVYIASGTIKSNVCLGFDVSEIEDVLVWNALTLANLHQDVRNMPEELNSQVEEAGSNLSGGQIQRIGIARALLSDPKILVLDEVTSSLDAITESEIAATLNTMKGKKTLIVIAHRETTISKADRVISIEDLVG
jgi:ABC-type multidrug transport system fused ATPase/permease subunit